MRDGDIHSDIRQRRLVRVRQTDRQPDNQRDRLQNDRQISLERGNRMRDRDIHSDIRQRRVVRVRQTDRQTEGQTTEGQTDR